MVHAEEEIFEMNNGCICCTVRGDLIRLISGLLKRAENFDGVLIETTGLADPAPVIQTFFVDDDLRDRVALDSVVTMVDAKHFLDQVDDAHEAEEQIAFADVVVINKTDLVDAATLAAIEAKIRTLNKFARILHAEKADIPLLEVLDRGSFDLNKLLEIEPGLLEEDPADHEHDDSIMSVSLSADAPLEPEKFSGWMREFIMKRGTDVLRSKGILSLKGQDRRYVFQGIHMVMDSDWGPQWQNDEPRSSRLVFIGRNLDSLELQSAFNTCVAS
jgi:G3E family GTPase